MSKRKITVAVGGGGATGAATAALTYSSVAATGFASTGTAIGSLAGVAQSSATLAWFGGGSLAAGGGGVALGTIALTGGAVAVAGVAAYGIYRLIR